MKTPPHDKDLEGSILAACLLGHSRDIVDSVSPLDFYLTANQLIFTAICELFSKNITPDLMTVVSKLQAKNQLDEAGGATRLAETIDSAPLPGNIEHCNNRLKQLSALRKLIITCQMYEHEAHNTQDPDLTIDKAQSDICRINIGDTHKSIASVQELCETIYEEIETKSRNPQDISGVKSGFTRIDYTLHGFQASDFIILAARPSMGKSALMLDIAKNAQVPVGIFSLEMSKTQLAYRLLAQRSGVRLDNLLTGRVAGDQLQTITNSLARIYEYPIFIDDTSGISMNLLRKRARYMKKDHGIKILFVDYLQLISAAASHSRDREVAGISSELKGLAKDLEIPVVVLSQLNRNLEARTNKRPRLSDLRDSGTLEQDADVVLFLYRPEPYIENKFEKGKETKEYTEAKNDAEVIISKHRNGKTGLVKLFWNPEITSFFNLTKEQEA